MLRQRDIDTVTFMAMGGVLGAILHDAGLSIWLIGPVVVTVALSLVGIEMLKRRRLRNRG